MMPRVRSGHSAWNNTPFSLAPFFNPNGAHSVRHCIPSSRLFSKPPDPYDHRGCISGRVGFPLSFMRHYDFADQLHTLYAKACKLYTAGQLGAGTYFNAAEAAFLAANGLSAQNLYDYAEDDTSGGEPGWNLALAIELVRRDYFLNVQNGTPSGRILDESKMPAKTEAIHGIAWLPRLIPKAKAKLRGELPSSLMFCCGGDRAFFQAHDIHPAEFLTLVWRNENNDTAIVDWVLRRRKK